MNELYEEAGPAGAPFEHQPTVVIYDNSGNPVNEFHVVNEKTEPFEETQLKSKFWTHEATMLLIELYKTYQESMKDPRIKKKDVWNRIAADMGVNGYQFHGDMCDKKWRNLKKSYNGVLENNRGPGQGRRLWQYFDTLHDIFSKETDSNDGGDGSVADVIGSEGQRLVGGTSSGVVVGAGGSGGGKGPSAKKVASSMLLDSMGQKVMGHGGAGGVGLSESKLSTKLLKDFFEKQERNDERRLGNLIEELRKYHQENLEVMRERNRLLQRLVDSLSTGT